VCGPVSGWNGERTRTALPFGLAGVDDDDTRNFLPFVGKESQYFLVLNGNKKSTVIDLKKDDGKDLLRRLAAKSDVLIENYRRA